MALTIISLGGSIIAPDGVDSTFLSDFRKAIITYLDEEPEARLVFECRKAYSQMMDARSFEDKGFLEKWYADSNFHKMYVGIIESAYKSV